VEGSTTIPDAPPPFTGSTGAHMARFDAIWVTSMGLLLLLLSGGQLLVWDDPGALLLALTLVAGGGGIWIAAKRRLAQLHPANRAYLLGPHGAEALGGREQLARRVRSLSWTALGVFIAAGALVIWSGSALGCVGVRDDLCSIPELPAWAFPVARAVAVAAGAAFVGLVVLGRSHAHETERMDAVIAEGQHRRLEGPIPGTTTSRWE